MDKALWERAVEFHGHTCMGLATGFHVAMAAMEALGNERDIDEQMIAIVENDNCSIDAIQVITGCTVGKGNLILRDYGKLGYTFALREKKKAIRITVKDREEPNREEAAALREKVAAGTASEEEKGLLQKMNVEMLQDFLSKPFHEVCEVKEIAYDIPGRARIFPSVICSVCGEKMMEPRARLQNGKVVCIPCSEQYSRGW